MVTMCAQAKLVTGCSRLQGARSPADWHQCAAVHANYADVGFLTGSLAKDSQIIQLECKSLLLRDWCGAEHLWSLLIGTQATCYLLPVNHYSAWFQSAL